MPTLFVASPKKEEKKEHQSELLATFCKNPNNVHFRGQDKNEKILLLLRRHWVTNIGWLSLSFLLLILPVAGIPFIDIAKFLPFTIPVNLLLVGFALWYLVTFGYILINFFFWFFNVNLVTNKKVIDVDFVYLLYNETTMAMLSKIEDVTYKRGGFLGVFFDYGNVFIQTAGTEPNIEFIGIPKPATVTKIINDLLKS